MEFSIEKKISNFISNQFPQFYKEEGENFILFMKAYYEWMEDSWDGANNGYGGPIREARELLEYRDIDTTIERFLEYFKEKYLYGIPFNVISNKRFLLKHILDVYRSKGTIQCYKLLFKLLYDEDIEIYLPSIDVLRVSDGTWVEPRYLEITDSEIASSYIGKTIIGVSSGVTAIVESLVKERYNTSIINVLHLSNILPKGGKFNKGEKVTELGLQNDTVAITEAPTILGSLDGLTVINGGQGYVLGDVIKIVHRDVSNGDVISYGIDGILKITKLSTGFGSLVFDIVSGGFGYTANASTFLYKNTSTNSTGQGASFKIGSIIDTQNIQYNTDLICDYMSLYINATSYGFPANSSANQSSTLQSALSYANQTFGSIFSLTNIETGNGYNFAANAFVRSTQLGKALPGTGLTYSTNSSNVTCTGSIFNDVFGNNDVIALKANSSLSTTLELAVIKEVTNSTHLVLYGPPSLNSTASASYFAAPTILPSQYAVYEAPMLNSNNTINGENELIRATPSTGNNIAAAAVAINSGKGYIDGEQVKAYLYNSISNNITILDGGSNYTNGELIYFVGGEPGTIANGYITTDNTGMVVSTTITNGGSGYRTLPNLIVNSPLKTINVSVDSTVLKADSTKVTSDAFSVTKNGSGAKLTATLQEFNTTSTITARVEKTGIGKGRGYWSTTRGFLNSDKYIQDSYYYQDYSYEIRVAKTLDKYKDIIYNTFHSTGSELFGVYLKFLFASRESLVEDESATIFGTYTVDATDLTSDSTTVTSDSRNQFVYLLCSETNFTSDSTLITVDKYLI